MKRIILFFAVVIAIQSKAQNNPVENLNQLFKPNSKNVLISAHRGDWRNAPENSIQSLKNCIVKGIDIVELDLKKSKDGVIIVMHDATIDRTTTGKGKPEDYNWHQLEKFYLLAGSGVKTRHKIPRFEDFLDVAKGKVILCIDKGIDYFDQAMDMVNERGMANQIIYLVPHRSLDSLYKMNLRNLSNQIALNVVAKPSSADVRDMVKSYQGRTRTLIHPTFASDTIAFVKWMPQINKMGLRLWLNALWPEHNGGHDDDRAVELNQRAESWGWLINHGANIIQTDRPKELLDYLRQRKLHK